MTRTLRSARAAFTLVELLVVMSLVVVLAGLTVAVAESGAFGSQKVVSAADRASGWLLIAKQRALRDGRPRGVRFLLTPANNLTPALNPPTPNTDPGFYVCREAQYVEIPDAWSSVPTPGSTIPPPFLAFVYQSGAGVATPPLPFVTAANVTSKPPNPQRVFIVLPTTDQQNDFSAREQAGSLGLLVLPNQGGTFRVDQILPAVQQLEVNGTTVSARELVLGRYTSNPPPYLDDPPGLPPRYQRPAFTYPDLGATATQVTGPAPAPQKVGKVEYNFAFTSGIQGGPTGLGGPQPLVGEPLLQLSGQTIVIDVRMGNDPNTGQPTLATNPTTIGVTPAGVQYFDVLFSPSGQVLGTSGAQIALWLRDGDKVADPRASFDAAGEQVLVTVYTRTGAIATHPVTNGPDPYTAAKDGLNSGL